MKDYKVINSIKAHEYADYVKETETQFMRCVLLEKVAHRSDISYNLWRRAINHFETATRRYHIARERYNGFKTGCRLMAYHYRSL